MRYYAIVESGVVVNIIVCNGEYADGIIITQPCSIGWTWDGEQFLPPEIEEVTDEITNN